MTLRPFEPDDPERPARPHYRPPIGVPVGKERRLGPLLIAVALHLLLLLLVIVPLTAPELVSDILGAGGAGPAGGGGGGRGGTGGTPKQERIQFVRVAPPAPTPTPTPPVVKPPEVKPPVVPPPPVPPPPEAKPQPPADPQPSTASADAVAPVAGTGGGAGNDGTAGAGPGSGGGVGTGIGTGKGSGVGAGTGGGTGSIYPPSPTEIFLPPLPVPGKAKGALVVLTVDVDSTGKVVDMEFTPTKDSGYNRKLREAFQALRFRPAVTSAGVPVRAKTQLQYKL